MMFSENNKISVRQIKYLLWLDWVARLVTLLPVCLSGRSMGSMIFCVLTGTVLWWLLSAPVLRWLNPERNIVTGIKQIMGTGTAVIFCFAGLLYFLVQAAVFLNLTAELSAVYLLPEVPVPVICLLPVIAAVFLAMNGLEVPGRFSEVTGPVTLGLLALLIFIAAFGMEIQPWEDTLVHRNDALEAGSFEVLACLGGLFLPVFGSYLNDRVPLRKVRRSALAAVLLAGSLCAIVVGSYGEEGMQYMEFPAVRVMSNLRIPGGFVQRWDVLFLGLLLVCLTVTVTVSLWYVKEMTAVLWGLAEGHIRFRSEGYARQQEWVMQNRVVLSWAACILLVYLAAAGFLSSWSAIGYYRALNLQVLTPLLFFFYIIMAAQRMRKRTFRLSRALVMLLAAVAAVFLLTGCTACEPEERLFPMALEIRAEEGELVIAYAWDEETAPGSVSGSTGSSDPAGTSASGKSQSDSGMQNSSGESGKYAENRNGITVFRGSSLEEIKEKTSAFSERYMDYSHVKAVLLDESLKQQPKMKKAVMEWMAWEPAFASGLIIYEIQEEGIVLEQVRKQAGGQVGKYLENLYNNNETYRERSTTLGRLIAEFFREKSLEPE